MRMGKAELAYFRAQKDVTQKRLSEISGVSRATISAISCGKSVSSETAQKIANALKVSLGELLEQER